MKTKEIIINIEAKNEKELFHRLVKAKYLIEEHFQDERRRGQQNPFRNFDICSKNVQVIIRDKKGMFDNAQLGVDETVYFEVNEAKEISIKDLKTMRKYADGLRKKGFAISPVPKKKAKSNKADGYYFPKLKDLAVNVEGDTGYGEWITFKETE